MMAPPTPSPRILVVDDDPGLREVLVDYLGQHGFEAAGAASAAESWSTGRPIWWCWT